MSKISIAIIGAGLAGLSAAWHLLHTPSSQKIFVTLFDGKGVGGGASGAAAGLLHPFTGAHAKKLHNADMLLKESFRLLEAAAAETQEQVILHKGILRPACTPEQEADFSNCAERHSEALWYDTLECKSIFSGLKEGLRGLMLPEGIAVNMPAYLEGLWLACEKNGAKLLTADIKHLSDLAHFDHIVIAAGASSGFFKEAAHLKLNRVKGQLLRFLWPEELQAPKAALNSNGYLVMSEDGLTCLAGSTFEREFTGDLPDPDYAISAIIEKIRPFFPKIDLCTPLECISGIRSSAPNHLPVCKRLSERLWIFAGLGSKGLIYHACLGKHLAENLLKTSL